MESAIKVLVDRKEEVSTVLKYLENRKEPEHYDIQCLKNLIIRLDDAILELSGRRLTGFVDINGKKIREGDILSDNVETDSGTVKSYKQVFFNIERGMWMIDDSFSQDKHSGSILSSELLLFDYHIAGNIVEHDYLIHPITDKCG